MIRKVTSTISRSKVERNVSLPRARAVSRQRAVMSRATVAIFGT
jgi:hypothetical protein